MRFRSLPLLAVLAVACSSGAGGGNPDGGSSGIGGPDGGGQLPGASTPVTVSVPASMRSAPFDVPRSLAVPQGFSIAVYARVPGARFIAVTPEGNLLVSRPGAGKV